MTAVINIIHILATAIWIGGAFFVHFILQPSMRQIDSQQSWKLMGVIAKRFSITAWTCIILLIITGVIKTPSGMLFDQSTQLGQILTVKHILVLLVVIVGLVIGLIVVPKIRMNAPKPGESPSEIFINSQKKLSTLATINLILGGLIVVCASLLW